MRGCDYLTTSPRGIGPPDAARNRQELRCYCEAAFKSWVFIQWGGQPPLLCPRQLAWPQIFPIQHARSSAESTAFTFTLTLQGIWDGTAW